MQPNGESRPWYLNDRFRRIALIVFAVFVLVEAYYGVFRRQSDFRCHVLFGQNFLLGEPYASVGNYYPLARIMADTLLVSTNYYVARGVCYTAAILGLLHSIAIWSRLAARHRLLDRRLRFAAAALTLSVLLPFVIRDLDECGFQILLLWMLSLAAAAFASGGKTASGFWLAAAASFKATPLLFVPFLLWKREWRTAGAMALFIVGLNLVPAVYLGWGKTLDAHRYWFAHTTSIMRDTAQAHPEVPGIEPPKHNNLSVRASFARLVETYPPGHALHIDHPLFVQFGNLPVARAKQAVTAGILLLGLVIAWKMRHRWDAGNDGRLAPEWSIACLYSMLLSPLCWKQHFVLIIPTILLIAIALLQNPQRRPLRWMFAGVVLALLLPSRFLLGKELTLVLLSYNLITFAAIAAGFLLLSLPNASAAGAKLPALEFPEKPKAERHAA